MKVFEDIDITLMILLSFGIITLMIFGIAYLIKTSADQQCKGDCIKQGATVEQCKFVCGDK